MRAAVDGGRGTGKRLSKAAWPEVGRLIEQAHAEGVSYAAIAEAIGVSEITVTRWRDVSRFARLEEVRIVDAPALPTSEIIVHGPLGLRVEGMTLDDLAKLWSRLSS